MVARRPDTLGLFVAQERSREVSGSALLCGVAWRGPDLYDAWQEGGPGQGLSEGRQLEEAARLLGVLVGQPSYQDHFWQIVSLS